MVHECLGLFTCYQFLDLHWKGSQNGYSLWIWFFFSGADSAFRHVTCTSTMKIQESGAFGKRAARKLIISANPHAISYNAYIMDIAALIQKFSILAPAILLAVTVHEMAHGWVAYRLGDPTAKQQGRLTLNPFRHLDPMGTLVFFITQTIGWARPVPVNPAYFRNPRRDMIWVSLAGPGANILLAVGSAVLLRTLVVPLVGPGSYFGPVLYMALVSVQINIGLAVFNLIPIPPLDGSTVLVGLLPPDLAYSYQKIERYGFIIILVLVFTGVTGRIIVPLIQFFNKLLLGFSF